MKNSVILLSTIFDFILFTCFLLRLFQNHQLTFSAIATPFWISRSAQSMGLLAWIDHNASGLKMA